MARDNDPLLQPFQLRHLRLRNRIMTTSHEPAYPEDGMPKARYRAYHVERAKGGVAMTMTAGSATVSRDSPPVFNNVLAYQDEVVPWMRDLTDAMPRTRRRRDDPAHPPGPAHELVQGRLVAGGVALA
jgi:2,4-dienoyl-CoA reductase-like NADH-dependent reductase (Old Yellow Enzyme family)